MRLPSSCSNVNVSGRMVQPPTLKSSASALASAYAATAAIKLSQMSVGKRFCVCVWRTKNEKHAARTASYFLFLFLRLFFVVTIANNRTGTALEPLKQSRPQSFAACRCLLALIAPLIEASSFFSRRYSKPSSSDVGKVKSVALEGKGEVVQEEKVEIEVKVRQRASKELSGAVLLLLLLKCCQLFN